MNSGPRRRNFEVQPVDRPGGAFARQEDIAAIWRVLHNVQVGNQRGICNRDSLRVPGAEADSTAGAWRAWYNGGLIYLRIGPEHVTDRADVAGYSVATIPSNPWSTWAYANQDTRTVAVDPSGWTINADGSDVYLFFQTQTGYAFIDTVFGRGTAVPAEPGAWGNMYHRADSWRSLRIGTLYNSGGGLGFVPAYPQMFVYSLGLQARFRMYGRLAVCWANHHGETQIDPGGGFAYLASTPLPTNSSGYLYYVQLTPPPTPTGNLSLTSGDVVVGYYLTDSYGVLYLWETPINNLQPLS